ncbi:MAG: polymer-forming cytoskeletal protein [Deltaproteobacteria bacterium]|nr:polymer-forming cytoskeletal protein [Deltaproteobacteria bacterium]MBW2360637.1 polymer-forming cytoskeletal protein [Deltaproteobacteria bacterium]
MAQEGRAWVRKRIDAAASGPREAAEGFAATFIDHGADFDGILRLTESFRIDGEFRGSIESRSIVTVGESAGIEAHVRARDVIVAGAVVGNITATRQLTLRGTARVHGNIETPSLEIERGAMLNGSTSMVRPEVAARRGARAATSPETRPAPRMQPSSAS